MRKLYRAILKDYFCASLIRSRMQKQLTQSKMAERLSMDDRSYNDLDTGKTACSAVTLALYIVYVCDDVKAFVEGLRHAFESGINDAA